MPFLDDGSEHRPLRLTQLPISILEGICQDLARCDLKKTNLFSFSLTSKACASVSSRERFKRLRFRAQGRNNIERDARNLAQVLGINSRSAHVRQITIDGFSDDDGDDSVYNSSLSMAAFDSNYVDGGWSVERGRRFNTGSKNLRNMYRGVKLTQQERRDREKVWQPVANTIGVVRGLKDVVWEVREPMPRCLLDAVEKKGPTCRLHMHTLTLDSLCAVQREPRLVDPDEVRLVTCPNLHSIIMSYCNKRTENRLNYDTQALVEMVWQLAPNIEHVWMRSLDMDSDRAGPAPDPSWAWFMRDGRNAQPSRANLRELILDGHSYGAEIDLVRWGALTNLACLTSLEMWRVVPVGVLVDLADLLSQHRLPSLRGLALHPDGRQSEAGNDSALGRILCHIECLESFAVVDFLGPGSCEILMEKHGPSLRHLVLDVNPARLAACLGADYERPLCIKCPNLTQLSLPVQRDCVGGFDAEKYGGLGRLKHLERLTLWLYFTWDYMPQPGAGNWELEEVLMNAAVDEELVKTIFGRVNRHTARSSRGARRSCWLQHLTIEPRGFGSVPETDGRMTVEMVRWVAGRWTCERDYARRGGLVATELDAERQDDEVMDMLKTEDGGSYKVWCRLWGEGEGEVEWMDSWSSFPLGRTGRIGV